jgi:hypothetical protein
MRNPEEIITELAPAYNEWKGGEKSKNKLKTEFFEAITEHLAEAAEPAEDLLTVHGYADEEQAITEVEKQRPGWKVDAVRPLPDTTHSWEVIVVEDPAFMPFTIEYEGQVWGRQIAEGSTMLDDERLAEEDPELWKAVSAYPMQSFVEDLAYEAGTDHREVEAYVEKKYQEAGMSRSLKSMDEIDDELLPRLQEYTYVGPPTIKLPAPKKVKE